MPGCHLASKKKFFRERRGTRGTKGGRFDVNVPRGMKLTWLAGKKQPLQFGGLFFLKPFRVSSNMAESLTSTYDFKRDVPSSQKSHCDQHMVVSRCIKIYLVESILV